jgi:hypothetical protein
MRAIICVNNAAHQKEHAAAMKKGLAKHGIPAHFIPKGGLGDATKGDIMVMWGYKPPHIVQAIKANKIPLLVMERGYFPDRFVFSSMGWNGLNNRAKFPYRCDFGYRFQQHWPDLLKPWKEGGRYVLVCGQVPGDAAIYGADLDVWAQGVVNTLVARGEQVVFRPHPFVKKNNYVTWPKGANQSSTDSFMDDLKDAKTCVTYNSNAGVEAVCAGVPTVTMDKGAMAWPVTSHSLEDPPIRPDRTAWAHQLAWCQWQLGEIADGTAWEALRTVLPN